MICIKAEIPEDLCQIDDETVGMNKNQRTNHYIAKYA
jgi:hypothetical protein